MSRPVVFPFTAIVGQERAKLALIINAINPLIGGVLLRGDRGTGKSTMVRAFAQVLPEIEVVADCPFNCNPRNPAEMCELCYERWRRGEELPAIRRKMRVVELPLNATIDRVVGTLDVRRALREGIRALEPGILAEANRNILYIDEVNLLDDYIVDVLLDAAASGWNIVEREGVSVRHPARFILVGSMNPEEGELRPQILDRFGLVVDVEVINDPELRCEIVERVEEFSRDPEGFLRKYEAEERRLRERIERARRLLPEVKMDRELVLMVARLMTELRIPTHRAEITAVRAAKAIAAFNGRRHVEQEDVKLALELVLPHRLRRHIFDEGNEARRILRQLGMQLESLAGRGEQGNADKFRMLSDLLRASAGGPDAGGGHGRRADAPSSGLGDRQARRRGLDRVFGVRKDVDFSLPLSRDRGAPSRGRAARRVYAKEVGGLVGAYVTYVVPRDPRKVRDVAIDATIRAAVMRMLREGTRGPPIVIADDDIREKVRRRPVPRLIVFVLDSSGSMAALCRIELAKGILWSLAKKAYISKDEVALIVFRRDRARVVVEPTRNYPRILRALEEIPTGGKTPLSHALLEAYRLVWRERMKRKNLRTLMILVTDGKANVPLVRGGDIREEVRRLGVMIRRLGVESVIVDTRLPYEVALSTDVMDQLVESLEAKLIRAPVAYW